MVAKRKLLSLCLVISATGISCKSLDVSPDSADVKTLENFAAGETIIENACGADRLSDPIDDNVAGLIEGLSLVQASESRKESLATAMGSMPVNLLNLYFATGNRIVVSDKAFDGKSDEGIDDCQIARRQGRVLDGRVRISGRPELESCIVSESQGDGQVRLGIYIKDNDAAIRHALVRRMSQAVSMHLSRLVADQEGKPAIGEFEDESFVGWKSSLLTALDKDIAALPAASTSNYRKLRSSLKAAELGHYAFAEAMDSFYCSSRTRENMKAKFPSAHAGFLELDAELRQIWSEQSLDTKSTELALGPVGRVLVGAGRVGMFAARGVGRVGYGAARVGAGVVRGTGRVAFGAARFAARGTGAVIRGGANVIQGVGSGVSNAIEYRRGSGYVFPRMHGVYRR
ncbi:MAG: hypothetical protein RIQ81_515 [Pseudomonadota bacterium]|jgi:hypothetical protein